jgi:hypothetical protein
MCPVRMREGSTALSRRNQGAEDLLTRCRAEATRLASGASDGFRARVERDGNMGIPPDVRGGVSVDGGGRGRTHQGTRRPRTAHARACRVGAFAAPPHVVSNALIARRSSTRIALGRLLERQPQAEHHSWLNLPTWHEADQLRRTAAPGPRATVQVRVGEKRLRAIDLCVRSRTDASLTGWHAGAAACTRDQPR